MLARKPACAEASVLPGRGSTQFRGSVVCLFVFARMPGSTWAANSYSRPNMVWRTDVVQITILGNFEPPSANALTRAIAKDFIVFQSGTCAAKCNCRCLKLITRTFDNVQTSLLPSVARLDCILLLQDLKTTTFFKNFKCFSN